MSSQLTPQIALSDARGRVIAFGIVAALLLGALAISFVVTPEDIDSGRIALSPTCMSRRIFGVECPTCGLTRGFAALSHGRWSDALSYNRGAPVWYGAFWLGGVASAWSLLCAVRDATRARRAVASSPPDRAQVPGREPLEGGHRRAGDPQLADDPKR